MENTYQRLRVKLLNTILLGFVLGLTFPVHSFCQGAKVILSSGLISEAKFHVYEPYLLIEQIYTDTTDAVNQYPEQLMTSIVSSNSREWERYNDFEYDEESSLEYTEGLKYELIAKLEFVANGTPMAIVKFQMIVPGEESKVVGVTNMQKSEGRWGMYTTTFTRNLSAVVMLFKSDILERLFLNNPANELEKSLLDRAYNNGLDIDKMATLSYTEEERAYYLTPLNW